MDKCCNCNGGYNKVDDIHLRYTLNEYINEDNIHDHLCQWNQNIADLEGPQWNNNNLYYLCTQMMIKVTSDNNVYTGNHTNGIYTLDCDKLIYDDTNNMNINVCNNATSNGSYFIANYLVNKSNKNDINLYVNKEWFKLNSNEFPNSINFNPNITYCDNIDIINYYHSNNSLNYDIYGIYPCDFYTLSPTNIPTIIPSNNTSTQTPYITTTSPTSTVTPNNTTTQYNITTTYNLTTSPNNITTINGTQYPTLSPTNEPTLLPTNNIFTTTKKDKTFLRPHDDKAFLQILTASILFVCLTLAIIIIYCKCKYRRHKAKYTKAVTEINELKRRNNALNKKVMRYESKLTVFKSLNMYPGNGNAIPVNPNPVQYKQHPRSLYNYKTKTPVNSLPVIPYNHNPGYNLPTINREHNNQINNEEHTLLKNPNPATYRISHKVDLHYSIPHLHSLPQSQSDTSHLRMTPIPPITPLNPYHQGLQTPAITPHTKCPDKDSNSSSHNNTNNNTNNNRNSNDNKSKNNGTVITGTFTGNNTRNKSPDIPILRPKRTNNNNNTPKKQRSPSDISRLDSEEGVLMDL